MTESSRLPAGELQARALRGVGWSSLSSMVALPFGILVSAVVARSLGVEGYARFALLTFLVPLLYTATDLGYAQATARVAAQSFSAGDLAATRQIVGKALGWNLLRLPLLCALTLAVARPSVPVAAALVAYLVLTQAAAGLNFSLNAENRGAVMAKIALAQILVTGTVSIAAALAGASATTVWGLSFASGAVAAPAWALAANPALRRAALVPLLPRRLPGGFWRFSIAALAASLGSLLVFSRSEVLVLEWLGDERALAVFALAFGLSQRLTTPVDTLLGPLTSALSGLASAHPERLHEGFGRALRLSAAASAFLAGSALVATALAAPLLFGPEYEGIAAAFAALAAISLLRAAAQPYPALAYALGRPGSVLRALGVALVVDLALAVALIPPLGVWGAVVANAAGGAIALVLTARALGREGAGAGVPAVRLAAAAGLACALAYGAGLAGAQMHAAVGALAAAAVGTLAFVGAARALRGLLPREDVDALLALLPPWLRGAARAAQLVTFRAPDRRPAAPAGEAAARRDV